MAKSIHILPELKAELILLLLTSYSWVLLLILTILFFYAYIRIRNNIILLRETVKESYSGITIQLKYRYDLIPNLVKITKKYAQHEASVFQEILNLRINAISNPDKNVSNQSFLEVSLQKNIKNIFALSEQYPGLKSDKNFLNLQKKITIIENRITGARDIYNSNTSIYNTKIKMFPFNLIAWRYEFKKIEYFQIKK